MSLHNLPVGSLFPTTLPADIDHSHQHTFTCTLDSNQVSIFVCTENTRTVHTTAPRHYFDLVRRFLWRREVLSRLIEHCNTHRGIASEIQDAMARHVLYLDAVLDATKSDLRKVTPVTPPARVRLFDICMLEEYFVGRHEPAAVIRWQMTHEENLRTTDPARLDWSVSRGRFGTLWDGERHRWDSEHITDADLKQLIKDAACVYGDFYDHPYPRMEAESDGDDPQRYYGGDVIRDVSSD